MCVSEVHTSTRLECCCISNDGRIVDKAARPQGEALFASNACEEDLEYFGIGTMQEECELGIADEGRRVLRQTELVFAAKGKALKGSSKKAGWSSEAAVLRVQSPDVKQVPSVVDRRWLSPPDTRQAYHFIERSKSSLDLPRECTTPTYHLAKHKMDSAFDLPPRENSTPVLPSETYHRTKQAAGAGHRPQMQWKQQTLQANGRQPMGQTPGLNMGLPSRAHMTPDLDTKDTEFAKVRALVREGHPSEEASASDSTALRYFSDSDSSISDDTDDGRFGVICRESSESSFTRPACVPRLRIPPPISGPLSQCIQAAQEEQQPKARGQSAFMAREAKRAQRHRSSSVHRQRSQSMGAYHSNSGTTAPPRPLHPRPRPLLMSREATADRPLDPLPCRGDTERLTTASRGSFVRLDASPSQEAHLSDMIAAIGRPLPPRG